jgi:hypothetical protein
MNQVTGTDDTEMHTNRTRHAIFDDRSLSIFRILFGLTLLLNNLLRTCEGRLEAFYTNEGVLPLSLMLSQRTLGWSFLDAFSSLSDARIAFIVITLVYVAYTIGLFTRYTKWLVVLCLISLYHRNLLVNDGSDWVMRFLALWTAFLPLGRRWSIDSRFFGASRALCERESRLGSAGFCVNLSLSYLLNVLQKDGSAWSSGDAVRRVLWNAMVGTPLAVATRESSLCPFLDILTYATRGLEVALSITLLLSLHFVWARRMTFLMILLLHGGFGAMLYLGTFVPIYLATAFLFLPGQDLDRLRWTRNRGSPNVIRSWIAECLAACMCAWCAVMLVMENPIVPEMVRAKLQGVISPRIRNWMNVPGILQRWYMFTAPGLEASTILIAARRPDGSLVDPIRNIPFDPQAPFRQSSYLGKYWVSYFYQLRQSGYGLYREPFAQWLFKQGYEEVFLQDASRTIPATCQGAPSPLHVSTIFRAFKPFVVKPRLKDVQIQNATTISVREQNMRKFGPGWTSDMQVHADFRHGSSELLIRFSSKRACRAQGEFFFTYAPDYGRFDISVNEGPQTLLDLYTPFGVLRRSVSIGALALREGENTIRIALRSDTDPVRTKFGIDEVSFRCEE